jgi:hypothetical protein
MNGVQSCQVQSVPRLGSDLHLLPQLAGVLFLPWGSVRFFSYVLLLLRSVQGFLDFHLLSIERTQG